MKKIKNKIPKKTKNKKDVIKVIVIDKEEQPEVITTYYFTLKVEEAIIEYNNPDTNQLQRNKLYNEHIDYAFNKIAENLINKYNFKTGLSYFNLKADVVSLLIEKIHTFNPAVGAKAFSYFNNVARNHLVYIANKYLKHPFYNDVYDKDDYNINIAEKESTKFTDLINFLKQGIEVQINTLNKEKEHEYIKFLEGLLCIIELHQNPNVCLDIFNRKYLKLHLKDITDIKSDKILQYINRAKDEFMLKIYNNYFNNKL